MYFDSRDAAADAYQRTRDAAVSLTQARHATTNGNHRTISIEGVGKTKALQIAEQVGEPIANTTLRTHVWSLPAIKELDKTMRKLAQEKD